MKKIIKIEKIVKNKVDKSKRSKNLSWRYRINKTDELLRLRIKKILIEAYVFITKKKLRCRALEGNSNYNICINSDLSVSCNCYDTFGYGRIGDLNTNTLSEIINGENSISFKEKLKRGRLAIPNCAQCADLIIGKTIVNKDIKDKITTIKGLMLENFGGCNLACIGCTRPERPMKNLSIEANKMTNVIKQISELNVEEIFFYSLGEPFLSKNIKKEIQAIKKEIPGVRLITSTNGVYFDSEDKYEAASGMHKIVVSLFGSNTEVAQIYQIGTDYDKVLNNINKFKVWIADRRLKPTLEWKYLVFNWNDDEVQIRKAIRDAKIAGFDKIRFISTTRPFFGFSYKFFFAKHFTSMKKVSATERVVILR